MTTKKHTPFIRMLEGIWGLFLNGLFTILPITLTIGIFTFSWRIIKNWLEPIKRFKPAFLETFPHAELIIIILFIFLIGLFMRLFILHPLVHWVERFIAKIPLVRPVYGGVKQLIGAFSSQDKLSFKKVVIVEFPRNGVYSIGFLTSQMPVEIAPNPKENYFHVFIPTTPNPTSGFFVIVPEKELEIIDLTRQEAMALIISGGIILPERFNPAKTKT